MKLVTTHVEHTDTIVSDDGVILGVIYYSVLPLDDDGTKPASVFRAWFADVTKVEDVPPPSAG